MFSHFHQSRSTKPGTNGFLAGKKPALIKKAPLPGCSLLQVKGVEKDIAAYVAVSL
jgi:hypothetical protein